MKLIQEILVSKNLDPQIFEQKTEITADMPIDAHVAWVYNNIYSIPYPKSEKTSGIARQIHGIQHVTRAAINIPIFANLYRRYGDKEALLLTDEDIKLLQIAALFHDSAREGEETDYWDQESALFFYNYATKILHIDPVKAKLIAEAIANKDAEESNYFELVNMVWVKRVANSPKNIFQKLIHDADCLEILRARPNFDANYLDFYKDIASKNEEAFEIMAKLITEARSLIAFQGDSWGKLNHALKLKYENQNAYQEILNCIDEHAPCYPLILALSHNQLLSEEVLHHPLLRNISTETSTEVTEESLTTAMNSGRLFARGIGSPAAFYLGREKNDENAAQLEIRKMTRIPGVATRTKKPNNLEKNGNPNRSVSMIGYGAGLYASQGFLILNPNIDNVGNISPIDNDTARGKKNHILASESTRAEKEVQLKSLHRLLMMGGSSRHFKGFRPVTHNEILYRLTKADAIYFTQDPTFHNDIISDDRYPYNRHTHYLQALFLQIEYENATGKKLPIFEHSVVHNFIKAAPIYTEEEIVAMWVAIVSKVIKENLASNYPKTLDELKIEAIDGTIHPQAGLLKKQTPLDLNYSPLLRAKIDSALEEEKAKCLREYNTKLEKSIRDDNLSVFSCKVFKSLIKSSELLLNVKNQINSQCLDFLSKEFKNPKEYFAKIYGGVLLRINDNDFGFNPGRVYFFARILNEKLSVQIENQMDEIILDLFNSKSDKDPELSKFTILHNFENLIFFLAIFDRFNKYQDRLLSLIIDLTERFDKTYDIYSFQLMQSSIGNVGFLDGEIKVQIDKIKKKFLDKDDGLLIYEAQRKEYIKKYVVPKETFLDFSKSIYEEVGRNFASYDLTELELSPLANCSSIDVMEDDNFPTAIISADNPVASITQGTEGHDVIVHPKYKKIQPTKEEIIFLNILMVLKDKARELRVNGHKTAADEVTRLSNKIKYDFEDYKSNKISLKDFKKICKDEIKESHKILDIHRGYKKLLINLALAICTLGIGHLGLSLYKGHLMLFNPKTKSGEQLDKMELALYNMNQANNEDHPIQVSLVVKK